MIPHWQQLIGCDILTTKAYITIFMISFHGLFPCIWLQRYELFIWKIPKANFSIQLANVRKRETKLNLVNMGMGMAMDVLFSWFYHWFCKSTQISISNCPAVPFQFHLHFQHFKIRNLNSQTFRNMNIEQ